MNAPLRHDAQAELAAAIKVARATDAALTVYRHNRVANAVRALRISFPTLAALLGDAGFAALAERYLAACPPHSGDWGDWGERLPTWLAGLPQLADYPYLADCATLDWRCHVCERAADALADRDSFAQLVAGDPYALTLVAAPGVDLMHSSWPLTDIWLAHHAPPAERALHERCARERLGAGRWQAVLVARRGGRAQPRTTDGAELALLEAALCGISLGDVLDAGVVDSLFLASWLPAAVGSGLMTGIRSCNSTQHGEQR